MNDVDQFQKNNLPALLNVNSNEIILQSISNDQTQTPTRQKKT